MGADNTEERFRLLLVEDDEVDRMAFTAAVKKNNLPYDCLYASSVAEAAEHLKSGRLDVAIVDYKLGDGTAFDVFHIIGNIPKIFTTGAGDEEIAIKAMKAGVYDYLIKDPSRNYLKVLPGIIKNAIYHKRNEDGQKEYHTRLEELVKERTEQLAKEKELLAVSLSSMSDAVIAVDIKKRIFLFNTVAENLTGLSLSQVENKVVDEVIKIVTEKTAAPAENIVDYVLATGRAKKGTDEDCIITKTNSLHPVAISAAPIRSNSGEVSGAVLVLRDVTREREVERMKADFISSVTHDLRTPLASIKAYTETILTSPDMPATTREEFLSIIEEETNRLSHLVESILEVSRIESGTIEIVCKDVNVTEIIRRVVSAVKPLAEKRNVTLTCSLPDEEALMQADEVKIESIITNLLNNAVKFTLENGSVDISAERKCNEIQITVSDTGIGIPKDSLSKIFDRFYRVYRPEMQVHGSGLGLAIVKHYVNLHSGQIKVESEEGKGSRFTVVLPLSSCLVASANK